ncbi:MAG: exodeoxyribonuclease V subunit gamma [Pirellulales bacterium]
MPLQISYVERLEDVIAPAVEFLSRDRDLFAKPRIVVPTAGAKAWLFDRLARHLGAAGRQDGVVAQVDIGFPGTITSLLEPPRKANSPDPWSFDRLTFAVLYVMSGQEAEAFGIPFEVTREPLLAARRIAGLFDNYHVRRPGMILEWERAGGNPVLNPTANDEQRDGHPVPALLRDADRWQLNVWRAVRRLIGEASPPSRGGLVAGQDYDPLFVAGMQSLSLPQLECLEKLAAVVEVEVLLVHPSSGLRVRWSTSGPKPLPEKLRSMPLQKSRDLELPEGVDQLLPVWLAGAHDVQDLVTARGVPVADRPAPERTLPDTLLGRMQRTVLAGDEPEVLAHDPVDRSLVIHRCHSLSRQVEVVHDAILQAFAEIKGLEPHDVAIVSPCIQQAAPLLEAVFAKQIVGIDKDGKRQPIDLPLVVADRGIRELSAAAELLVALLALPGARCSIDDVLGVAGHTLVRERFGIDDDTVALWADLAERTAIRWGLDGKHRDRHGLVLAENPTVHTWALGLERMLLGATLPDAPARAELGGVVPLDDLDPADLAAIAKLARIFDVIRSLEDAARTPKPVAGWCADIEVALVGLCGTECRELAEPLAQLRRLRQAAAGTAAEHAAVPFDDVRELLATWFDEKSARQSFRTGAIMATSMVPLRGVPFKVVCVVGYDDGVVGGSEADGDDLVTLQQLVGDIDPRADERRALLDCLLAADTRLVITCTGRSVKTNEPVPLVTPLAELVDFAVRHGVSREKHDKPSGIEIEHPRHHLSLRNFVHGPEGGVMPGTAWSHDAIAAKVAQVVGANAGETTASQVRPAPAAIVRPEKPVIELAILEKLADDPLRLFLEHTLGIKTWREDDEPTPATLPLTLPGRQSRALALELLPLKVTTPAAVESWKESLRQSGLLPFGRLGERQLDEIEQLVDGMIKKAGQWEPVIPLTGFTSRKVRIDLGNAIVEGDILLSGGAAGPLVTVRASAGGSNAYGRPLHCAAIHLVTALADAALAHDIKPSQALVVARHDGWTPGELTKAGRPVEPCQIRPVVLGDDVDPRERLAAWCDLAIEALAGRRGLFGLRDEDGESREEGFENFVTAKNFATGESRYAASREAIAYGMAPVYADVFAEGSAESRFLDRYGAMFEVVYQKKGKVYRLA